MTDCTTTTIHTYPGVQHNTQTHTHTYTINASPPPPPRLSHRRASSLPQKYPISSSLLFPPPALPLSLWLSQFQCLFVLVLRASSVIVSESGSGFFWFLFWVWFFWFLLLFILFYFYNPSIFYFIPSHLRKRKRNISFINKNARIPPQRPLVPSGHPKHGKGRERGRRHRRRKGARPPLQRPGACHESALYALRGAVEEWRRRAGWEAYLSVAWRYSPSPFLPLLWVTGCNGG